MTYHFGQKSISLGQIKQNTWTKQKKVKLSQN